MITFSHAVKYNGKYYPPHTPVEEKREVAVEPPIEEKPTKKPKKVKKDAESE